MHRTVIPYSEWFHRATLPRPDHRDLGKNRERVQLVHDVTLQVLAACEDLPEAAFDSFPDPGDTARMRKHDIGTWWLLFHSWRQSIPNRYRKVIDSTPVLP